MWNGNGTYIDAWEWGNDLTVNDSKTAQWSIDDPVDIIDHFNHSLTINT